MTTNDARPTIASMIGSEVEVWFDRKQRGLMVKDALGHAVRSIYSVCLSDVIFHSGRTKRGAVRCYATGRLMCDPNSNEATELRQAILRQSGGFMQFHWWKDTAWPMETAVRAVIGMPHGGFPTSAAHQ